MFQAISDVILSISREAWGFMTGILLVVASLGGLFYILQGTAGAAFGGTRMTANAVLGTVGIFILVLVGFLLIPELTKTTSTFVPAAPF